ncbi:serine hydrolase domain-containing protein [Longispora albida]|uniref:serine hydrolase domain-containing protein n=1 Tax=Longispora albida TaxID=203523 RepID=UPI00037BA6B2|nr:serine hydrolase domain-containing protein [Longispora albida]
MSVVLAAVTVAAAAGCGGSSSGTGNGSDPAYAGDLRGRLQKLLTEMKVPGAVVMITSKEKGDWTATFGTRSIGGGAAMGAGDHFRVGSNTKTMTGTVILQLVQEGKLALNDPIAKYRQDVPGGDKITIAQLLDMRSGLYNYSEDPAFNAELDKNPGRVWQPAELVTIGLAKPPYFPPGEGFHYSNTNTVLLGLLAEQLTGGKLADEFQKRIFGKLGLKGTSLPALDDRKIPDPHPQGYMFGTNIETLEDAALPAAQQSAAAAGTLLPSDHTDDNPSWAWAAGGAISTAGDLQRYVKALIDGELLNAELQKTRIDSIRPSDPSNPNSAGYGLGIAKFGPLVGHDGQMPGFNSFMARDKDKDVTVIVMTSLFAAADGRQPANVLALEIIQTLYGRPTPAPSGT